MLYKKKRVKLPPDMVVGSQVGIVGEGYDTQFITAIERDEEGNVTEVHLSGGCREPLSKIYLCRQHNSLSSDLDSLSDSKDTMQTSYDDRTGWIKTSIGECDMCGRQFPDSCVYESDPNKPGSMICLECSMKRTVKMKLFKIWQTENLDYDRFDSAVVAAESEEDAKKIHPGPAPYGTDTEWPGSGIPEDFPFGCSWASSPSKVFVEYLGEAKPGTERGVICASFNAS